MIAILHYFCVFTVFIQYVEPASQSMLSTFRTDQLRIRPPPKFGSILDEAIWLMKTHFLRRKQFSEKEWMVLKTEYKEFTNVNTAVDAFMQRFGDPYSRFIPSTQMTQRQRTIRGEAIGIGALLKRKWRFSELRRAAVGLFMANQLPERYSVIPQPSTSSTLDLSNMTNATTDIRKCWARRILRQSQHQRTTTQLPYRHQVFPVMRHLHRTFVTIAPWVAAVFAFSKADLRIPTQPWSNYILTCMRQPGVCASCLCILWAVRGMLRDVLSVIHPVVVGEVFKGGPGDVAGLLPGDQICNINGKDVTGRSLRALKRMLDEGEVGDLVSIEVLRQQIDMNPQSKPGSREPNSNSTAIRTASSAPAAASTLHRMVVEVIRDVVPSSSVVSFLLPQALKPMELPSERLMFPFVSSSTPSSSSHFEFAGKEPGQEQLTSGSSMDSEQHKSLQSSPSPSLSSTQQQQQQHNQPRSTNNRSDGKATTTTTSPFSLGQRHGLRQGHGSGNKGMALEGGVGYIYITEFTQRTLFDVETAILDMKTRIKEAAAAVKANGQRNNSSKPSHSAHLLRGIVFDLRGNLGGTLPSALDAASLFLPAGKVLLQMKSGSHVAVVPTPMQQLQQPQPWILPISPSLGANATTPPLSSISSTAHAPHLNPSQHIAPRSVGVGRLALGALWKVVKLPMLLVANVLPREGLDKYRSTNFRPDEHTPLLLLVDSQTASASEIFAAALMDHNRALCLGTKTVGKNVAQAIMTLSDGSGLVFTIREFLSPTGRSMEGGICPDYELSPSELARLDLSRLRCDGKGVTFLPPWHFVPS